MWVKCQGFFMFKIKIRPKRHTESERCGLNPLIVVTVGGNMVQDLQRIGIFFGRMNAF